MKKDKVSIKNSKIHGKGVFANKNFKKGEIVLHWDISNTITKKQLDSLSEKDKGYITNIHRKFIVMQEPEKYVNHSCNPNTKIKNFSDVAIKNIKLAEEITGDYSEDLPKGMYIKCRCNSKNCKKTIKRKINST